MGGVGGALDGGELALNGARVGLDGGGGGVGDV